MLGIEFARLVRVLLQPIAMKTNLAKKFEELKRFGMSGEDIETLSEQVPGGRWRVDLLDDGSTVAVSIESKDAVAWIYKAVPEVDYVA